MKPFLAKSKVIFIPGVGPVLLEKSSRAKRLNITVRPFKGIRVAIPRGVSFERAEQAARTRTEWMKFHLDRMNKFEVLCRTRSANRVAIDRKAAGQILVTRLEVLARMHGYVFNRVSIRNQKTRWGSCSASNNISLNIKLTLLPDELRDFIILHELVHTRVKNHGEKFWAELLRVEPDARKLDRQMNEHSILLVCSE